MHGKTYFYDLHLKSGDKIPFGKYKGSTFDFVCQFDMSYIEWMHASKICDDKTLQRAHEGKFKRKKLKEGSARVWEGNRLVYSNP